MFRLKEMIGLPTERHEPMIETSRIMVNKELLRELNKHRLPEQEEKIVCSLIATYHDWYDANLEVLHELVTEQQADGNQTRKEKQSHDDPEQQS